MKSAEDIYQQATLENLSNPNGTRMDIILAAIKLGMKEGIAESAKEAKVTIVFHPKGIWRTDNTGRNEWVVDKESILKLIEQIK